MAVDVIMGATLESICAALAIYAGGVDHAPLSQVTLKSVEWRLPPPRTEGSRIALRHETTLEGRAGDG